MDKTGAGRRVSPFKQRITRKQYWMGAVALVGIGVVADLLLPNGVGSAMTFPWLLLYGWRLHDFGRSGWWGVLLFVVCIAMVIAGVVLGGKAFALYLAEDAAAAPTPGETALLVGLVGGAIALQLGFMVWLGVKRGDAGENRYGWPLGHKASG